MFTASYTGGYNVYISLFYEKYKINNSTGVMKLGRTDTSMRQN